MLRRFQILPCSKICCSSFTSAATTTTIIFNSQKHQSCNPNDIRTKYDSSEPNCVTLNEGGGFHRKYLRDPDGPGGVHVDYDAEYQLEYSNVQMAKRFFGVAFLAVLGLILGDYVTNRLPHGDAAGQQHNKTFIVSAFGYIKSIGKKEEIPIDDQQ
jgi:hypothetical protein